MDVSAFIVLCRGWVARWEFMPWSMLPLGSRLLSDRDDTAVEIVAFQKFAHVIVDACVLVSSSSLPTSSSS